MPGDVVAAPLGSVQVYGCICDANVHPLSVIVPFATTLPATFRLPDMLTVGDSMSTLSGAFTIMDELLSMTIFPLSVFIVMSPAAVCMRILPLALLSNSIPSDAAQTLCMNMPFDVD